ncbi:hypothetical protein MVES1_000736 [Malassezia vespertilionis]|uniref:Uncharacterized protein n=1 Tax=Malassezia vespertilionis TaxID=2020962 RepID=A0A2N1JGB9_9BASI|nr:uncharacterized protein MVES1_000736 [Malassezia vespertilionis]PKI85590.1 hypothetical protein MVES_000691 [Malassezia vespertilionis]WFD05406.1 hypothetical protein MVES1_000736 [Malassezia vespertilionis]
MQSQRLQSRQHDIYLDGSDSDVDQRSVSSSKAQNVRCTPRMLAKEQDGTQSWSGENDMPMTNSPLKRTQALRSLAAKRADAAVYEAAAHFDRMALPDEEGAVPLLINDTTASYDEQAENPHRAPKPQAVLSALQHSVYAQFSGAGLVDHACRGGIGVVFVCADVTQSSNMVGGPHACYAQYFGESHAFNTVVSLDAASLAPMHMVRRAKLTDQGVLRRAELKGLIDVLQRTVERNEYECIHVCVSSAYVAKAWGTWIPQWEASGWPGEADSETASHSSRLGLRRSSSATRSLSSSNSGSRVRTPIGMRLDVDLTNSPKHRMTRSPLAKKHGAGAGNYAVQTADTLSTPPRPQRRPRQLDADSPKDSFQTTDYSTSPASGSTQSGRKSARRLVDEDLLRELSLLRKEFVQMELQSGPRVHLYLIDRVHNPAGSLAAMDEKVYKRDALQVPQSHSRQALYTPDSLAVGDSPTKRGMPARINELGRASPFLIRPTKSVSQQSGVEEDEDASTGRILFSRKATSTLSPPAPASPTLSTRSRSKQPRSPKSVRAPPTPAPVLVPLPLPDLDHPISPASVETNDPPAPLSPLSPSAIQDTTPKPLTIEALQEHDRATEENDKAKSGRRFPGRKAMSIRSGARSESGFSILSRLTAKMFRRGDRGHELPPTPDIGADVGESNALGISIHGVPLALANTGGIVKVPSPIPPPLARPSDAGPAPAPAIPSAMSFRMASPPKLHVAPHSARAIPAELPPTSPPFVKKTLLPSTSQPDLRAISRESANAAIGTEQLWRDAGSQRTKAMPSRARSPHRRADARRNARPLPEAQSEAPSVSRSTRRATELSDTSITQCKQRLLEALCISEQPEDPELGRAFADMQPEEIDMYIEKQRTDEEDTLQFIPLAEPVDGPKTIDGATPMNTFPLEDGQAIYVGFRANANAAPAEPSVQLASFQDEEGEMEPDK